MKVTMLEIKIKPSTFISILIYLLLFISSNVDAEKLDHIVAVVNNRVITQNQLDQQLKNMQQQLQMENVPISEKVSLRKKVLQHMIDTELQLQLIKKIGMDISTTDIDHVILNIAYRNHLTLEELKEKVRQEGISYTKYQQEIRQQILITQLQQREIGQKINITSQEIEDSLDALKKHPPITSQAIYRIQDILIPFPSQVTQEQINKIEKQSRLILQQAHLGKNVNELAQSYADKLIITDLGWRKSEALPDLFVTAVQHLSVGEIAGPLKAANGFHLIKLVGKQSNELPENTVSTHVRHILIKTTPLLSDKAAKQRLLEIRDRVLQGGNFAELANKYSQDFVSANKGGDLGWPAPDTLDSQFETVMDALKPGELSQPFKTAFGWHLIQVIERKKIVQTSEEFLRERAKQIVYQRKFNTALQNWLKQLRNASYIQIIDLKSGIDSDSRTHE